MKICSRNIAAFFAAAIYCASAGAAETPQAFSLDAFSSLHTLGDLQCSADGKWAAYAVGTQDLKADKRRKAVWMVGLAGVEAVRLTPEEENSSAPLFSPDGRFIAFLSKRGKDAHRQIYLLDRQGGEARRLTDLGGEIAEYAWSPDSRRIAITMTDPPTEDGKGSEEGEKPKPLVIDGYRFKEDGVGFLSKADHNHLYLFDLAGKSLTRLTPSSFFNEGRIAWSPDGSEIAFIEDHIDDPEAPATQRLQLILPREGAEPRTIASFAAASAQKLLWIDDGKKLLHLVGFEPKFQEYSQPHMAVTEKDSGRTTLLGKTMDRPVTQPVGLAGSGIGLLLADDRHDYAARLDLASGSFVRLTDGKLSISDQCGGGRTRAVIASGDGSPSEVYLLDGNALRPLTSHNKAVSESVTWGAVEDFSAQSADGTEIHGMMVKPPDYRADRKYPTIAWIHGGPNGQDSHALSADGNMMIRQWLAAHGYIVLAVNYRGSNGRGDAFARAIAADWGNKEVADIEAAVDWAVAQGIADNDRLGIGGWSYGAILTEQTIVKDPRFKAAVSGAGVGNLFGLFGVDQYIMQYSLELGAPWRKQELYQRLSAPFFHVDRIKIPTLFMGGTSDENVPLIGGLQMYQAFKLEGIPTQLIAYPGEYHGLRRPSFLRDRLERVLGWYDRYLGDL